ncbi:hypothetical protein TSMG0091 [Halocynthia phage JM-2012]|uniref:hypothetical protein n=1 Tax=Halocynthia phage JM-2012 TaxID=1173297 RepID=UPI00025C692F|nr:hypothetical protein TSMG0091 [Halocynthia phage JM-2012]AFI55374.1 hypothetical protein TSMG0091 [Halocynthia phage JM-2012]
MNNEFFKELSDTLESEANAKVNRAYELYLKCDDMFRSIVLHHIGLKDVPTEERIKECFDTLELLDALDHVIEEMEEDIKLNGSRVEEVPVVDISKGVDLNKPIDNAPLYTEDCLTSLYWSVDDAHGLTREDVDKLVAMAKDMLPIPGELNQPTLKECGSVEALHERVGSIELSNVSHNIIGIRDEGDKVFFDYRVSHNPHLPEIDMSKYRFGYRGFCNKAHSGENDIDTLRLITFDLIPIEEDGNEEAE